jgi:hypothetical protein
MLHPHVSVRFYNDNINHGFREAKGLMTLEKSAIVFEFEIADTITGMIKSDLKKVKVSFSELTGVQLKKQFLRVTRIVIKSRTMAALGDVPGSEAASVTLKIRKPDREDAEGFVSAAAMALSEFRLAELESGDVDSD